MSVESALRKVRNWKQTTLNITLVLSVAASPLLMAIPAHAVTFVNDYPDMDAVDCSNQFGIYSWCKEENGQQGYVLDEAKSSRGFYYRNCVDGAAYWVKQYTGVTIPGSWGNAVNWDNAATSYTVKDGTTINGIEPGDIAQSDDGADGYGHVGFVISVNKDPNGTVTSITTAELNSAGTGQYSTPTYSNKNAGGKFIRSGSNDWDHFIDVNGAGYGLGNEAVGIVDTDHDGVPDSDDIAVTTPGPTNNRGIPNYSSKLSGDFNGDGKTDVMAFYDYGSDSTSLKVFFGNGDGTFSNGVSVWDSGIGNWRWANTKTVTGDFNGDGKTDIVAIYNYGSDLTKMWLFPGTSAGSVTPVLAWNSGIGNWRWGSTKAVSGDFNGDGKLDVGAFYDYGSNTTSLFRFYGNGDGTFANGVSVWGSAAGAWRWASIKPVAGDFNGDGKAEVGAFYDYGSDLTKLWIFPGSAGSTAPTVVWDSGIGNWRGANMLELSGDFNGDGKNDVGALYDYGGGTTALFRLYGNGNNTFATPVSVWNSGPNSWVWANIKPTTGDFNGDNKTDVGAFYNYGSGNTSIWVFQGSTGQTNPSKVWSSGAGNWEWSRGLPL